MVDLNSVVISGRVVADSVSKMTVTGKELTSFGVACNDDYKNKVTNEWVSRAYFFNCVYWKNLVLKKGEPVVVYGKLETNTEDYNGQKRTFTKISVNRILKVAQEKKTENVSSSSNVAGQDFSYVDQDKTEKVEKKDEFIPF